MRNTLISLRLLILAAILGLSLTAQAQAGVTSEGREFWFGFMPNWITPAQAVGVYVSTSLPSKIKLEIFGAGGAIVSTQSITLAADQAYRFKISVGQAETRELEKPSFHGIRVTSTSPCTIVGLSDNSLSTDAFLGIPIPALGTEYYCASYYDDAYQPGLDHLGGEFLIVAPYDGTTISITTKAQTTTSEDGLKIGHEKGATWTVNLSKGQTYLVQSTGFGHGVADLTGSFVTSNKPVAFLSGHQRTGIETGNASKEHLIEMIPPVDYWGLEYIGAPQQGKPVAGNLYRVISAEDSNQILTSKGALVLQAGEFAEVPQTITPIQFKSVNGKKFLVVEYGYSQNAFGDTHESDATMIVLTPTSAYVDRALFRTVSNVGTAFKHYANFVAPTSAIHTLTIKKGNNSPASFTAFGGIATPIQGTDYSFARLLLSGDEVTWVARCDKPFAMTIYGHANSEAYGFPGPRSFADLTDTIPPNHTVLFSDDCGQVRLRVHDKAGIQDLALITPQDMEYYNSPSFTENFAMKVPDNFVPGDTSVTLILHPIDTKDSGSLALHYTDRGGNSRIFTSTYVKKEIEWKLDSSFPLVTRVGDTVCRTVTYWNRSSDSLNVYPYIPGDSRAFFMPRYEGVRLGPGDSLVAELCFIPEDSLTYTDSVSVITDCYVDGFVVTAKSPADKIFATDRYFGVRQPHVRYCMEVEIVNRGELPITVTGYERTGDTTFTVSEPAFPFTIAPKAKQLVTVCFETTRDTGSFQSRLNWILDHPTNLDKTFSIVSAIVLSAGVDEALSAAIKMWPNPASSLISISLPQTLKIYSVSAIDMRGAMYPLQTSMAENLVQASVNDLAAGTYLILLETSQGQITRQLVIKR